MKLICFAGLPGTGKTYAATKMEAGTGAIRISRDEIRAKLFDHPAYTSDEKSIVFEMMQSLARHYLRQGRDVILDGMPFSKRSERDSARRLASVTGAKFEMYHCTCPEDIALSRIAVDEGKHEAGDRNADLYYRVKAGFEPFGEDESTIDISSY